MTSLTPLFPRQKTPDLELTTVTGKKWKLSDQKPEHFTMIVFYRGMHCPVCRGYLQDLNSKAEEFASRGVNILVASSDSQERAEQVAREWSIGNLTLAYGLTLDKAREWGLYISSGRGKTSIGIEEPALFSEPALYLVRPDSTLYFGTVQTMPFARPVFADILKAVDFVIAKDYPGRGEVVDHRQAAAAE